MDELGSKPSMKDEVLKFIESGQVKMRPKWQFATRTALLVVGTILIALTTLYLTSFIVFMLRQTGVWFTPGFGRPGFGVLFSSLPWILIALSIIFIVLLEILIKKYSFAYGRPFLYSALGVILLVVALGVGIGFTSFHKNLFDRSENGRMPFGGPFYEHYMQPADNVTVGTIIEVTATGYKIQGHRDEIFTVTVTPQTQLPPDGNFKVGDNILVLGPRQGSTISAVGIQKPGALPPPSHGHHGQPEQH